MKTNKVCRVCDVELADENWSASQQKFGNYICKECAIEYAQLYREENPDKLREYQEANRDKLREKKRLYTKANPDKTKANDIRYRRKNGVLPFYENKKCAVYYGVYINERLLKHYFDDVEVMPYGHPGYDFVCNNDKKIDGKSAMTGDKGHWSFNIRHNTTADYFFCVAYDNRTDLNILHIWILPGNKFNHLGSASISKSTLSRWAEYEQPLDKAIACCNTMKGEQQ